MDQDVEAIDLDHTFEDIEATKGYLSQMLDSMAAEASISQLTRDYLSPDGLLHLTLASGGVPRDYLTIFVAAIDAARSMNALKWLTPRTIHRVAGRVSYRARLIALRNDVGEDARNLERFFRDLVAFCLGEKRKTAFLISQEEASELDDQHDLIKQLMDFKLIHVVEPDTSAASGRPGRYEAYTFDFPPFMEPRLRGIEHVAF